MSSPDTPPPDELLSAHLDGELTGEARAEAERRVGEETATASLVETWRSIGEAVRDAEAAEVPADLAGRIVDAAASSVVRPPVRMFSPGRLAAGALAATVVVTAGIYFSGVAPTPDAAVTTAVPESLPEVVAAPRAVSGGETPGTAGEVSLESYREEIASASPATTEVGPAEPAADSFGIVATDAADLAESLVLDAEREAFPTPPVAAVPAPASVPTPPSVGPPLVIRVASSDPESLRARLTALVTDPFGEANKTTDTDAEDEAAGGVVLDGFGRTSNTLGDAWSGGFAARAQTLVPAEPVAIDDAVFGMLDAEMLGRIEDTLRGDDIVSAWSTAEEPRPATVARGRIVDDLRPGVSDLGVAKESGEDVEPTRRSRRSFAGFVGFRPVYFVIAEAEDSPSAAAPSEAAEAP
ncbi:MAG: hypothetical protein AAGJ97_12335, partial [Planctomycetota bacterium]